MSTIQFGGVVSGLNTQSIIDALMAVEKQPLTALQTQEANLTTQKSAYGQLGSQIDDLVSKVNAFTTSSAGSSRTASSSDTSVLTGTASPSASVGLYRISVDRLATATTAVSEGAIGSPVTAASGSSTLASLNLPGSITGGQVSAIVDGVIVHYAVGDPATTTLDQLLQGLAGAIQGQLQTTDAAAQVSLSVVNNRLQLAVTGGANPHSISFGSAGDTSNGLGILGIATESATGTNPVLTGTTNLGVVRATSALDQAGLNGLTSTKAGVLTVNGVDITYDTTKDSLTDVVSRINNSSAGVIASLDRTNDQLVLTRKDTGSLAIDIDDTSGNLARALNLAPGTTNAQTVGQTAQLTVDGRTVTSTSNTVTNAIDGVTLNLVSETDPGTTRTLTIGVDTQGVTTAVTNFVNSFNALGDLLDKLTQNTPGTPGQPGTSGPLASDPEAQTMFLELRSLVTQAVPGFSGSITSLADIGVSTGAYGSAVGSTTRLQLDTDKLSAALTTDPNAVARLLDDATGALKPLLARLQAYENPSDPAAYIQAHTAGLSSDITSIQDQEADMQDSINQYQSMLEEKYTAMETMLATLQAQASQVAATLGYTSTSSSSGTSAASVAGSSSGS